MKEEKFSPVHNPDMLLHEIQCPALNSYILLYEIIINGGLKGHASMPHPFVNGRPGFNPIQQEEIVRVTEEQFANLYKIQENIVDFFGFPEWAKAIKPEDDKAKTDQKKHDDKKQAKEERRIRRMRFHDTTYVPGETFDYSLVYDKNDIERIIDNIKIARRNSRIVIAGIHDHRANSHDPAAPLPVLEDFARACIDAGADAFFGTGPHWLLGIEIYKKKPIFYSLGNFFFHSGGGGHFPPESYQRFGFPYDTRDTMVLDVPRKKALSHFTAHWESIVPFITYAKENELEEIKLYPIVLGKEEPIFRHGTPALAEKKEAGSIIEKLARCNS